MDHRAPYVTSTNRTLAYLCPFIPRTLPRSYHIFHQIVVLSYCCPWHPCYHEIYVSLALLVPGRIRPPDDTTTYDPHLARLPSPKLAARRMDR